MRLHAQIELLSSKHPRLGYRKLVRLLRKAGWQVGRQLVQRSRRAHGLRVKRWTKRPRRRGRSTGAIPTKAQEANHVWTWDFISDRSDNGSEFVARTLQSWLAARQVKTLYIAPGSPWQNGHVRELPWLAP